MSEIEFHLQRLTEWVRTLEGCPKKWNDILIVEDPSFSYRGKEWAIPQTALINSKLYESRFSELLNRGYSWINLNFGGLYEGNAIVFVEHPKEASGVPADKVSVNPSGPEGNKWDLTKRLLIK